MFSSPSLLVAFVFFQLNVRQSGLVRAPLTACLSADFCNDTTQKLGRSADPDPLGTDSPFVLRQDSPLLVASYRSAHELPSHSRVQISFYN